MTGIKNKFFYCMFAKKNKTMAHNRKWINIILHTIFWMTTTYWFTENSIIRPFTSPIREMFCAFLIAITIYLNYLVLIPQFYLKRKNILYFSLSLLSVMLCTMIEFLVVKECIKTCYSKVFDAEELRYYLMTSIHKIFLRDVGFFCFFILLKFYQLSLVRTELQNRALAEDRHILSVLSGENKITNLNINKIYYFKARKNILNIVMSDKRQHQLYMSLADIEDILPKSLYIKVNRNYIVMLNSIVRYDDQALYVKPDNQSIPFYATKGQEIKDKLYEWNPTLYHPVGETNLAGAFAEEDVETRSGNVDLAHKNAEVCDEFSSDGAVNEPVLEENPSLKCVFDHVSANPGCRIPTIVSKTEIPVRSVQRYIRNLKELGLVHYQGTKKTGGYYPISQTKKQEG